MTRRLEPGLYETLITEGLRQAIESLSEEGFLSEQKQIDPAEAPRILALHFEKMLEFVLKTEKDNKKKVQLYNKLLATIARNYPKITDYVKNPVLEVCEQLLSVTASDPLVAQERLKRPGIPISESALLVNARGEHRVGAEICSEIASADRIDLICSFLKWSGYRLLRNELKDHLQRQRKLRILTTCYMGATEQRVLDDLVERGADLRVSYETKRTRLHAKAWLFHRDTGYTTAYIGSSNLSHAALSDGLEWNVRLSAIENPEIIKKFEATFEHYWLDGEFEAYDPRRDHERFRRATNAQSADTSRPLLALDVNPYPFQEEILDELLIERHHKNNWKNLVVAATGTGKTVLAALDYKRMRPDINEGKLLYIAHRKEILQKSMDTFRIVLKDPSFGELLAGGQRTTHATHVFASVQSLKNIPLDQIAPGAFDMVIVDEIHHGAAPTYQCWLEHLNPEDGRAVDFTLVQRSYFIRVAPLGSTGKRTA